MAMTKEDYRALGRKIATTKAAGPALRTGSWQDLAFMEGYNEAQAAKRLSEPPRTMKAPPTLAQLGMGAPMVGAPSQEEPRARVKRLRMVDVPELYRLAQAQCFPQATREHLTRLGADHNDELRLRRRLRLHGSIRRVILRWLRRLGPAQPAFNLAWQPLQVRVVPMVSPAVE